VGNYIFFQNVTKTNDHCHKTAFLLKAILSEAMTTMLTQEPKKLSVQIKVQQSNEIVHLLLMSVSVYLFVTENEKEIQTDKGTKEEGRERGKKDRSGEGEERRVGRR
jgi:hypothetical protein